jgi:hypothetical protein
MNKPCLPDDLLSTLHRALEWKAGLATRQPAGSLPLGQEPTTCAKAVNQMVADLYQRTDLTDAAVGQIREAVDTLSQWARQWNAEHPHRSNVTLDYRIQPGASPASTSIEWKMTEDAPGMLADAFFKPTPSGGSAGGGLIGWGASTLVTKPLAPIAPPAKWLQVLAKTGAAKFEKDTKAHTVRFSRATAQANGPATPPANGATVPVVEIDGMRFPTRLRDEALAARRK